MKEDPMTPVVSTRADLDELRKLAEKATPGPWVVQQPGENDPGAGTIYIDTHAYEDGPYPVVAPDYAISEADAAFIAVATNYVRTLIQEVAISSSSATEHVHEWEDAPDDETGWHCPICGVTEYPGMKDEITPNEFRPSSATETPPEPWVHLTDPDAGPCPKCGHSASGITVGGEERPHTCCDHPDCMTASATETQDGDRP